VVVDDSPKTSLRGLKTCSVVASGGRGPYAARNVGWRSASADVVLFLDVRSRPRPNWSHCVAQQFSEPEVAVVGSEVNVLGGRSTAELAAAEQQFFRLANYLERPFFRQYLPTCNLSVRRDELERVGGFPDVRSGGDADLCWRILENGGSRQLRAIPTVLMDWVPRTRATAYIEQNYRYGRGSQLLRERWRHLGADPVEPRSHRYLAREFVAVGLKALVAGARRDRLEQVQQLTRGGRLAFDLGHRLSVDRHRFQARQP
jgi:glycosyltransferase involved in cell wall biosynthesis